MSLIFATIPPKRLAQGITSASSSFYINNIIGFNTVDSLDVTSADLGTQHYCVFRNDTGSKIEIMEINPTTISTGPITIVRRGLSYYGDRTTQTTANKLDWSANETIVQLGTDAPQIFQYLKEYIDDASIAGAVPASTTAAGIVVEGTQAQVDAKTATTTISTVVYKNFAPLDKIRATKYHDFAADSVGTDAYAITITPVITAYSAGQEFTFKAGTANTGACTLNVSGLGAKTIKKNVSVDLDTGDILLNQIVTVVYDGTNMQMKSYIIGSIFSPGDGSDGALSISSGTTTLASDKQYTSVSVTGTAILDCAGYRIYCQGTFTVDSSSGAVVKNNGGAGGAGGAPTAGAAGAIAPGVTVPAGIVGVIGAAGRATVGNGTNGTNGGSKTLSIGVIGVGGGIGGNVGVRIGGGAGGAGTISNSINKLATIADTNFIDHTSGTLTFVTGSAGSGSGGGGACDSGSGSSGGGGGSGGSGGVVFIASRILSLTGSSCIQARGGNGGNGGDATGVANGGGGGGGGGSGGAIILIFSVNSGSGTLSVSGGAAGAGGTGLAPGGTSGTAGNVGTTGKTYLIQV